MASVSSIEITRELRPCLIWCRKDNIEPAKKALFHLWEHSTRVIDSRPYMSGHTGGTESTVFGIVELEDGSVIRVNPCQIQFTDNKIQEYAFSIPEGSSTGEVQYE